MKHKILLGVTGGIAAYKAADIVRRLMEKGFGVTVMMTASAEKFITPLTFEALTGESVIRSTLPEPGEEPMIHIMAPREADILLVAPATANIVGKFANGIADDTFSTALLASDIPVVMAPAMNSVMYNQPSVSENINKLKERGVTFVGPASGELACGDVGEGKLSPVDEIVAAVEQKLELFSDLAGKTIIVTAGGTREPIDTVRYIGNRSSGKMGVAIAEAARRRGAKVILVAASVETALPDDMEIVHVETAERMLKIVRDRFVSCDALIMAAAVGDYRAETEASNKVKTKERWEVMLTPNPDILLAMTKIKGARIVTGFAAETENILENGKEKLLKKNLDLIVINDVSRKDIGFGADDNEVFILERGAVAPVRLSKRPKSEVAEVILDAVKKALDFEENKKRASYGK